MYKLRTARMAAPVPLNCWVVMSAIMMVDACTIAESCRGNRRSSRADRPDVELRGVMSQVLTCHHYSTFNVQGSRSSALIKRVEPLGATGWNQDKVTLNDNADWRRRGVRALAQAPPKFPFGHSGQSVSGGPSAVAMREFSSFGREPASEAACQLVSHSRATTAMGASSNLADSKISDEQKRR